MPPHNQEKQQFILMAHHQIPLIPIYEGDEDHRNHWFIYETIWDVIDITDESKQIS